LLRKQFLSYKRKINRASTIKRVFIFFGGVDPYNLTLVALKSLQHPKLKHLKLDVVIGANNSHIDEIELFLATLDNAVLHVQIYNIAKLMSKSDLAIGAGGSSTWERFAIGLPSIVITFGKDQEQSLKELHKNNITTWLGNVDQVNEAKLSDAIIKLIDSPSRIYSKTKKAQDLVDGYGAKRVVDLIKYGLSDNNLVSRFAKPQDSKLYWEWANDAKVRKNAFNEDFIEWEEHKKWFETNLSNSNVILLIIERDSVPIGQVRFNKEGANFKIDYSLAKQFRGKNLAIPMLNEAIDYLKTIEASILIAEVKKNNIASIKVFERIGFLKKGLIKGENKVIFQLKIN
jgi:RimJ/RimL family protein N-acetyltransferase